VDDPHAVDLPLSVNRNTALQQVVGLQSQNQNQMSAGASVEFRNIGFHYPEQPPMKGLKHVDFFVRPGTTTAIVGHPGAGMTHCGFVIHLVVMCF
jgi:ABC-type multidrug transport system fused ATPase/permease subunit